MKNLKTYIYSLFPLSFFAFICWIIYMANKGINSIFFEIVDVIPYGDKLGHALLYGTLALLLNLFFKCRTFSLLNIPVQLGGLLVLLFAFIEEVSQYLFPNRNVDYLDLIADVVGIIFFNYLSKVIKNKYLRS